MAVQKDHLGKDVSQVEAPGMPAPDFTDLRRAAEQRVNDAVLLVQEAEEALRRARKAERIARAQAADLGRS